jgi:hypothetical protein
MFYHIPSGVHNISRHERKIWIGFWWLTPLSTISICWRSVLLVEETRIKMNIESMRNYYIVRHNKCYAFTLLYYATNQLVKNGLVLMEHNCSCLRCE